MIVFYIILQKLIQWEALVKYFKSCVSECISMYATYPKFLDKFTTRYLEIFTYIFHSIDDIISVAPINHIMKMYDTCRKFVFETF